MSYNYGRSVNNMRKIAAVLCLTILSSSLAGCLWNDDDVGISFSNCPSFWHVEFFDLSNEGFSSWDGVVEFTDSNGNSEVLEYFSSNKKYVTCWCFFWVVDRLIRFWKGSVRACIIRK